jgi:hypothetical protein
MQRNPKHGCGEGKVTLLKTKLVIHSALGGIVPIISPFTEGREPSTPQTAVSVFGAREIHFLHHSFQPFIFALTIFTFGKSNTKRPNQQLNTSKRSSKNTLRADLKITITYEVKHMKQNENKNINWITMMTMFMEFMTLQNEYNAHRIKEYKEWEDKDCMCDLCNQATIQSSEELDPNFGEDFRGEWE